MQIEFKVIASPEENKDLTPYTNAIERDIFLWELFHNFARKWKHSEENPSIEEIMDKLYELKQDYGVIIH